MSSMLSMQVFVWFSNQWQFCKGCLVVVVVVVDDSGLLDGILGELQPRWWK